MASLFFGQLREGVPVDENVVRNQATPVDHGAPAAERSAAPDFNEPLSSDPNPALGMESRQLASAWTEGEQYVPWWEQSVNDAHLHNDIVNARISSAGTAAARESAGQWGHGTASYAIGIEPVSDLREGGAMGNDYFVTNRREVQEGMVPSMSMAPGYDQDVKSAVMGAGKMNARDAANGAYEAFYAAIAG